MLLVGLAEWTLYVPRLAQMILGDDPARAEQRARHREAPVATARRMLTV